MGTKNYKKIGKNLIGKDFIIGDVHGAYDQIWNAMKLANFNKSFDRLFAVGDLIDRGKESHRVTKFLRQPYVYSVLGNHDHTFLTSSIETLRIYAELNINGMGWISNITDHEINEIKNEFSILPYAIELETDRGNVGIVHGDIPDNMTWQEFVSNLIKNDEIVIETALEGRNRIKAMNTNRVVGIDRIFVGHTIQIGGVAKYGNVFAIDTGAILNQLNTTKNAALTMANINCKTECLLSCNNKDGIGLYLETSSSKFRHK